MKFYPAAGTGNEPGELKKEYDSARTIGTVRAGETVLFFRNRFRTYYIPYSEIERCFRRIYEVPMKMCCGDGELEIEHLILCVSGKEIADIPLPGKKAAQEIMRILEGKMPEERLRAPDRAREETSDD